MPAYSPLTKQDLVQKLKEQREASRQREADILARIKSLDARKKYVGELKSWMERRKLTVTDLLAMYRELMPKRAERPVKSKNPLQPPTRKSAGEQLVDAMREARMIEISALDARDLVERIGFKRGSCNHIIRSAIGAGLLRRGDRLKDRPGYMYVVTGGANAGKPRKTMVRHTPEGHGDPAFMAAVRKARLEKGWGGETTGKKMGVSGASISNWESGRYTPTEESRQKLVKLLGLPSGLGAEATKAAHARMSAARTAKPVAANGAAAL